MLFLMFFLAALFLHFFLSDTRNVAFFLFGFLLGQMLCTMMFFGRSKGWGRYVEGKNDRNNY